MNEFLKLFKREMKISWLNLSNLFSYISFFFLGILIFIFSIGSDLEKLSQLFEPIVWVIFLFSIILGSENFIKNDYNDGSLKELQFLGFSEELIIFTKSFVMWIILIFPSIFFLPLCSLMFSIEFIELLNLLSNILVASPSLILLSVLSSLISMQIKNKILPFVVILPFYIPVLIFSTSGEKISLFNNTENSTFFILIAIFFITLPLALIIGKLILKEINN